MSYAVIKTGGKQYKVKSGEILKIEKLPDSKPETKIEFNEILAYGDDKTIEIGTPNVEGAKVEANLIKNSKNRTILIFQFLRFLQFLPCTVFHLFLLLRMTLYEFKFKLPQYSCSEVLVKSN